MTKNIGASIRQRLLNLAKQRKADFNYILAQYAIQRLMYRLSISKHKNQFLLKGALLFTIWDQTLHRPTLDADLLGFGSNDVEHLIRVFKSICALSPKNLQDGIVFNPDSVQGKVIKEDAIYQGVRISAYARLDDACIRTQVDIGYGDVVTPEPEEAVLPGYLELPEPKLKVYPIYTVIAEKFQAMIALGKLNSRMKDFYDIWLLSRQFDFAGQILTTAIRKTFQNRDTEIPTQPLVFTDEFIEDADKQTQWKAFIRKTKLENVPEALPEISGSVQIFLQPVIVALLENKAFNQHWQAGGIWR